MITFNREKAAAEKAKALKKREKNKLEIESLLKSVSDKKKQPTKKAGR